MQLKDVMEFCVCHAVINRPGKKALINPNTMRKAHKISMPKGIGLPSTCCDICVTNSQRFAFFCNICWQNVVYELHLLTCLQQMGGKQHFDRWPKREKSFEQQIYLTHE